MSLTTSLDCFVFTALGVWKNFTHTNVAAVLSVSSRHPLGDNGTMSTPNVVFTEGVDYEVNLATSQMRLLSNALTAQFLPTGWLYGSADLPRIYVSYQWDGIEYHPANSLSVSNLAKLPNWANKLQSSDEITILLLGDSTNYNNVDNAATMWPNLWVEDIKALCPNIDTINLGWGAVGGTTSDTLSSYLIDNEGQETSTLFLEDRIATLGNRIPDLVTFAYINDCAGVDANPNYTGNIEWAIDYMKTVKGWVNTEYVLISGLVSGYTVSSAELRQMMINKVNATSHMAFVDVSTVWQDLFARKASEDILGNWVNHANSFSTIAYRLEMLSLLPSQVNPYILTTKRITVTPQLSQYQLTGVLAVNNSSITPQITQAQLFGPLLSAGVISITPQISQADLVGVLSVDNINVAPQIEQAQLIGPLLIVSNLNITPQVGQVDLLGLLISTDLTITPQISHADLVGLCAVDDINVTPQISPSDMVGLLSVDDLSLIPQILESGLIGLLVFNDLNIATQINQVDLCGILPVDDVISTSSLSAVELIGQLEIDSLNVISQIYQVALTGLLLTDNISITTNISLAELAAVLSGGGSIRSPAGSVITFRKVDGSQLILKRFITNIWQ